MGIQIPGWLRGVASIAVGADWPEADETSLRRLADAWDSASSAVELIAQDGDAAMDKALAAVLGDVNAAMAQYWENFDGADGAFLSLVALCDQLSESCDTTATDVEYAKLTIIAALALLAAELAALAAAAIPTLGASTAAIPAAQIATQVAVRMVVRQLIMKLLQHAAVSVAQNVLLDGAIQSLQILQGNRDRLDTGSLASGAIEGFVEGAVSGGVSRFGSGSPLGQIGTETLAGAAGSAASAAASGQGVSWQDLASGAIGGGVGAAGGGDTATRPTASVDAPRFSPLETPASTVPSSADSGPPPRSGGLNMGITEPAAAGGAGSTATVPAARPDGLNMGTGAPTSTAAPGTPTPPDYNADFPPRYPAEPLPEDRLGPDGIPDGVPPGMLEGWDRFGGLTEEEFASRYWDPTLGDNDKPIGWRYPDNNGVALDSDGVPRILDTAIALPEGTIIDRFGGPHGAYLSPEGVPFTDRALPPDSLGAGYHQYRVTGIPLPYGWRIEASVIGPGFGQPGGGTQYRLIDESGARPSVERLEAVGYLSAV
ncbi:glycohydrolase toxin TNT-related protein [Rhodococcus oryzae]|uniref:WXG100-like domain-containing protein n=1 Tax=Rhodococcus oryzae TaxID=2571143 RepID=UPI0037913635